MGDMGAPVLCGTNTVVSNPARQVPTICHDITQTSNDIGHACGEFKTTEKIQSQRKREIKSTSV